MRVVIPILLLGCFAFTTESAYAFCYEEAGSRYGISPHLLHAISKGESSFNPIAINYNTNGSYDYGLMQINSSWEPTLRKLGIPWDTLTDPCTNVMVGAWVLSQYPGSNGEPIRISLDDINRKLRRHLLHQVELEL